MITEWLVVTDFVPDKAMFLDQQASLSVLVNEG